MESWHQCYVLKVPKVILMCKYCWETLLELVSSLLSFLVTIAVSWYIITYAGPRTALIKPAHEVSGLSFDNNRLVCIIPSLTSPCSFSASLPNSFFNILLFYCCMTNYSKTCRLKTTNICSLILSGPRIWVCLVQDLSQTIQASARTSVTSRLKAQSGKIPFQDHSHGCWWAAGPCWLMPETLDLSTWIFPLGYPQHGGLLPPEQAQRESVGGENGRECREVSSKAEITIFL